MVKPIDLLGFGPTREAHNNGDGTFTVTVKPPPIVGGNGCTIRLTADQFRRYQQWENDAVMIQDALPELTGSEREQLMTGLNDDEFARATPEED